MATRWLSLYFLSRQAIAPSLTPLRIQQKAKNKNEQIDGLKLDFLWDSHWSYLVNGNPPPSADILVLSNVS